MLTGLMERFAVAHRLLDDVPNPSPVRTAVRIVLAALIVVLFAYVVLEQFGSWRRRRSRHGE